MKLNRLGWTTYQYCIEDAIINGEERITVPKELAKRFPDLFGWFGERHATIVHPREDEGWATIHPFYLVTGRGKCET